MEKHYLEQVQKLVDEKLSKQTNKERYEFLVSEMEKPCPNIKTIQNLLKFGVGKKIDTSELIRRVEEKIKMNTPLPENKFKDYVSELHPDKYGKISSDVLDKVKEFLIKKELKLDVNTYTKKGISLIHIAVGMGDVELAQMLIDRGADLNNQGRDKNWLIPSLWHSNVKESEDVKKLIKKHNKPHS